MHAGGMIRTAHLLAAIVVVLGALLATARPALARRYEWAFWGAALVLVITGFGNLATLGGALPGTWGARFAAKLAIVLVLLLASGTRIILVTLDASERTMRLAYGMSAALAASILALGLVLAHG